MSLDPLPLVLVLLAAMMHAGWNFLAKAGDDRLVALAVIKGPNTLVALGILLFTGLPARESWPLLAASVTVNCMYFYFLIRAYRGDLSLAYPISRGLAPLLVLALSMLVAHEVPSPIGLFGVLLISGGILVLALRREPSRQHLETLMWAGAVALMIAAYTVIDGLGARRAGTSAGYVAALSALTGVAVCGIAWQRRGGARLLQAVRAGWLRGLVGGLLMLFAYVFVVHAMTLAPMAQVSALRESSVIFAALLGVIVLKEPFGRERVLASALVAAGIVLMASGR
jgi:drug/metabolite transporter (DMT)-like permease